MAVPLLFAGLLAGAGGVLPGECLAERHGRRGSLEGSRQREADLAGARVECERTCGDIFADAAGIGHQGKVLADDVGFGAGAAGEGDDGCTERAEKKRTHHAQHLLM